MELYCAMCREEKNDSEFTPFKRNPALKDRNGKTLICRDCASKYVEERGNTKEALREILRLQDIPYIEKYAESALKTYQKKIENTNLIIKKNVFSEEEKIEGIETNKIQTSIYTCYCARLGVIPLKYLNYSYSDDLRTENMEKTIALEEQIQKLKGIDTHKNKEIETAQKNLIKMFGDEIYSDEKFLSKAVQLKIQECSLYKNNSNQRQIKFKLKNNLMLLIESGKLNKNNFKFLCEDEEKNEDKIQPAINKSEFDTEYLQSKWLGFSLQESIMFEKKYQELVRNYEIKTASHDEFLKLACVSSVKGNLSMAKGDVTEAQKWMTIFKDMTSAGKLQPQQMSKADLSGGLNNFGEFYKSVEQAKGVIEILPEFKRQPRDDADFVIYCLVQYIRRLKGMQDIKYEDIWEFYEEIAKANLENKDGVEDDE